MQLDPPPLPPTPAKNWFERNFKWFIPLVILVAVSVMCAGVGLILGFIKNSDAYQGALARIQKSPEVIEALGEPITDRFFFTGQINVSNDTGSANLQIGVNGSRGQATAYVLAHRSLGRWHYHQLIVALKGSEKNIDLSESTPRPPESPAP